MPTVKLDIEKLIEKLLHHYECVILPDFGGFIIRDSPCNFNVAKDKLKPYGKHIFFNPHLLQNDGLLYNEIQKNHQQSYQEAINSYQSWLSGIKQTIEDAGSKSFGHLGTFYRGNENNVWFSPLSTLNLAMDSYGLFPIDVKQVIKEEKAIQIPVEKKEVIQEEVIYTLADNKPIESFKPHRLNYKAWLVAATVALLAHVGYLTFEKTDVTVNEASIIPVIENRTNPADAREIADSATMKENDGEVVAPETGQAENVPNQENTVTPEVPVVTPEAPAVETPVVITPEVKPENTPVETPKETVQPVQPEQAKPETTPAVTEKVMTRVARYRMETNADYHCKDLEKKGTVAIVRQNGVWYEVLTEEPIQ